jgi:hypothetical protein
MQRVSTEACLAQLCRRVRLVVVAFVVLRVCVNMASDVEALPFVLISGLIWV